MRRNCVHEACGRYAAPAVQMRGTDRERTNGAAGVLFSRCRCSTVGSFGAPSQHPSVRDDIQGHHEQSNRYLRVAGESGGVQHGQDVVGDEVAGVIVEARARTQRVLEGGERADAPGELDERGPGGARNMHPGDARPAHGQQAAERREDDERQMNGDDECGENGGRRHARAS